MTSSLHLFMYLFIYYHHKLYMLFFCTLVVVVYQMILSLSNNDRIHFSSLYIIIIQSLCYSPSSSSSITHTYMGDECDGYIEEKQIYI